MSKSVTVRLPEDLAGWLEARAEQTGLPKGRIIRDQLERLRAGDHLPPFFELAGAIEGSADLSRRKGFGQ